MQIRKWMGVCIIVVLCAAAVTGCKKKGRKGDYGSDDIGGIVGSDIYSEELSDRPDVEIEYASQFTPVYFGYDSSQISPSERAKVEAVADYLRGNSRVGVIIEGHCDERGSAEYNLALGERRALAVRAYLIGLGIDGSKVQTKSYGEENPAAMGHDESSWSMNRRGEFVLYE